MRKNVEQVISAFKLGKSRKMGPISTDGNRIYSFSLMIASMVADTNGQKLWIREDEGISKTTSEHIRCLRSELLGYTRK